MLSSFVDGTKTMVEMTCLANSTGLVPDVRGMHGPNATIGDAKREYGEYVKHPWPADFFGDVEWLKPPPR